MEMDGENNMVLYGKCVRNYAVQVGRVIYDGCQEFARDALGSRYCEACGCDQNFHMMPFPDHAAGGSGKVHRPAISEESGITMVPEDDDKVKVDPPENFDENSTATNGSKKKQNKKKKKK